MDFGTLETATTTNNRTVKHFRKRHLSQLSNDATQLLKKSRATMVSYNSAFASLNHDVYLHPNLFHLFVNGIDGFELLCKS